MRKEFKTIIYSLFIFTLCLIAISKPQTAKAIENSSTLGAKPSAYLFKAIKGDFFNESVQVIVTKGNKVVLDARPDKDTVVDCSKLLRNLELKYIPNDTYGGDMSLKLRVPSDCEDGEYRLSIRLKSVSTDINKTSMDPAIELPVVVQVGNVGKLKFSADNFSIKQYMYGSNTYESLSMSSLFKGNFFNNLLHMPISMKIGEKTFIDVPEIKQISLYDYVENNAISMDMSSLVYNINPENSVINLNTNKGQYKIDVKSNGIARDIIRQSETLRTITKSTKPTLKAMLMSIKVPKNPEFSNFNLTCGYNVKNSGLQSVLATGKLSIVDEKTTSLLQPKDFAGIIVRPGQEKPCTVTLSIQDDMKLGDYSLHGNIIGIDSNDIIKIKLISYRIYILVILCLLLVLIVTITVVIIIRRKKKKKSDTKIEKNKIIDDTMDDNTQV